MDPYACCVMKFLEIAIVRGHVLQIVTLHRDRLRLGTRRWCP
jgi:hypothetical protein